MNVLFYRLTQFILRCLFRTWNRASLTGIEHLPRDGRPCIIATNHSSYLDPPLLGGMIRRPIVFLAKEELFRVPLLRTLIRWLGAIPIASESDFKNLRQVIRALKDNKMVCLFPEGTRSATGEIAEAKPGVAFLSAVSHAPVVPCYIAGTSKAMPRGRRFLRPARIQIVLGAPYLVGDQPSEGYREEAKAIMERIKALRPKDCGEEKRIE